MKQADPQNRFKKKVGFIVNPIAGMGGAVGLKGTDGTQILKNAVSLGAKPVAPARAELFLKNLDPVKEDILLFVGPGQMGENEAKNQGYDYQVFGEQKTDTTPNDTVTIAKSIAAEQIELLVFCGGDGTARDILEAVDVKTPVLGVPTGVKMHSAVFGIDPKSAARIAYQYLFALLPLWEAEVMDIDEEQFRQGRVSAKLHGYLISPYEPSLIQGAKMSSPMTESELRNQAAMAVYVTEEMQNNTVYVISAGTTTRTIGDLLDQKKTLLGVDLFVNKKIVAKDVNEQQILQGIEGKKAKIIVTPIGGQGFVFGRGNQQISPKVIRKVGKENIIVIATENKMKHLRRLKVDTGDPQLDAEFAGTIKVVTDYKIEKVVKIE